METILTIDIGGTAIKFGVADETGRFLQKGSLPTRIREKGWTPSSQISFPLCGASEMHSPLLGLPFPLQAL